MYIIESRNILTPQNGLNIYRGRTENSICLTEIPGADPMDIGIKPDAPQQLAGVLKTRRSKGMILMGNLGDPYNEYEDEYKLCRKCLKVIEYNDYGVVISTKRSLIRRDLDVLSGIARKTKCVLDISIPTLDEDKLTLIEGEEVISISDRLELIREVRQYGIDVLISTYPVIPMVNDIDVMDVVRLLSEYDILGIDFMDYRLAIKKSVREFFYNEYRSRFPDEYQLFREKYEESGELIPEDYKKRIAELRLICETRGIMYSSQRIKSWKRQYENNTTGKQMSLFEV